jgi:hypothetical protein
MNKGIVDELKEMFENHQEKVYFKVSKSQEYKEQSQIARNIFCDLKKDLTKGQQIKLDQLNSAKNYMETLAITCFYDQGFADATAIFYHILERQKAAVTELS